MEGRLGTREVRTSIAADVPLVAVDPVLMQQLLVNLLENAAKYTPEATELEVEARREGEAVVVEVRDRGPGLPAGQEEQVFERFHRGAHPHIAGAGLGLAICRAIAHAHGGTLHGSNRAQGGACFRLMLPGGGEPPPMVAEQMSEER
jgi:two-component system sensor histidine kinase KdpD